MRKQTRKNFSWQNTGVQCFVAVFFSCLILQSSPALARQMECSYDYITHLTIYTFTDLAAKDLSISYSFVHTISPKGGEEMYVFRNHDDAQLRGHGRMIFIGEKLFIDSLALGRDISLIDFERPTFKVLQVPAFWMEQSTDRINAPLVTWDCHRID